MTTVDFDSLTGGQKDAVLGISSTNDGKDRAYDIVEDALYELLCEFALRLTPVNDSLPDRDERLSTYNSLDESVERVSVARHYRNVGPDPVALVLTPGGASRSPDGIQVYSTDWNIRLEIFCIQTEDRVEDFYEKLRIIRQRVLNLIDAFPTFNAGTANDSGVIYAGVQSVAEPEWVQTGRDYLWTQEISITATQRTITVGGEYGSIC